MKNKMLHLLYIGLFLLICLTPFLGMLIFGPSEAAANEILANPPKLTQRDGSFNMSVADDTEDYIADRFAFRQELVTAWAKLNTKLLHTSVQEQVVLGKEDWLFYASTEDDYMGICADNERIAYAASNLALMQEYAHSLGAEFIFVIAPNKNSLYPAHMPSHIPNREESNALLLTKQLDVLGVVHADLFAAFGRQSEVLYFQTDSHWNGKGAALAADAILETLHITSEYFAEEFTLSKAHKGDLYEMLYPTGKETESDYAPAKGFSFRYDSEPNGGNAIKIETSCDSATGSLVCWRDSFGISLHPYLAQAFGKAFFSRSASYDLTEAAQREATAVVIELVERNLSQLWETPPIFPAPVRNIEAHQIASLAVPAEIGKETDDLVQIIATADYSIADEGSPLYIAATDQVFECCTIFEGNLRQGSAFLPADLDLTALSFIGQKDGQLIAYPITLN
ncbi:MAG: hypothetical protein IJA67_01565 [Oscillospiraceae bacterium]|nr:hypothetical protein [Oscillospiraceae bacterium]